MSPRKSSKARCRQAPRAGEPKELAQPQGRNKGKSSRTGKSSHEEQNPPGSSKPDGFLKNNGLSLAFIGLFVLCFFGEGLSGYLLQFEDPASQSSMHSFLGYFTSATFLQGLGSNWQAAILQLLLLIVFSVFLRQQGASHSRKPDSLPKGGSKPEERRADRTWSWFYRNSLSLAFLAIFLASFAIHFVSGASVYNQERMRLSEESFSLLHFLVSAKFWFSTLQTWQAEFFAISVFLILSVYLRQERSAESKPVDAPENETGESNE